MATVLIVDNASFMRSSLKYIIEMAGHKVVGLASDGVKGLKAIRDAGGTTIVEEPSAAVHYGMPEAAIETGAADEIISLPYIAETIKAKVG